MESVTLNSDLRSDALVIPGAMVDRMINDANEAQLKIYLYLLKKGASEEVTVSSIADYFNYTESDVKRALRFLNGPSEPVCDKRQAKEASHGDNVVTFSTRPSYSREKLMEFSKIPEISQLLFVAEQYMARPLKPEDISSMLYMYDQLGFSAELIEYLLEYCISNNKKSLRSIELVAAEWKEAGIDSLVAAKKHTQHVPEEMTEVLEAFGFDKSRQPVDAEISYVRKWTESYGYNMEIINQACQRTVLAIGKPNFRYANTILKGWHDAGVVTIADILEADEKFRQKKVDSLEEAKSKSYKASAKAQEKSLQKNGSAGKFRNFSEREYDYDQLMQEMLSN